MRLSGIRESVSGSRLSFSTYFLITVFFYVLPSYFWVVLVCLFVLIVFRLRVVE